MIVLGVDALCPLYVLGWGVVFKIEMLSYAIMIRYSARISKNRASMRMFMNFILKSIFSLSVIAFKRRIAI